MPNTIHVSATANAATANGTSANPYASIQAAINAAQNGDRILVGKGTYLENLQIKDKSLNIVSTAGPDHTTIQSTSSASVLLYEGAGSNGGTLNGFTITGGAGFRGGYNQYGGGVDIYLPAGSAMDIKNCVIRDNDNGSITFGGGVHISGGGTLNITNSLIRDNYAWANGGAILVEGANLVMDSSTVVNNRSPFFNEIGGISAAGNCDIKIKNSILWGNQGKQYDSFTSGPGGIGNFTFENSVVLGGVNVQGSWGNTKTRSFQNGDNFTGDPVFSGAVDFSLSPDSPYRDLGSASAPLDPDGSRAALGYRSVYDAIASSEIVYSSVTYTLQDGEKHLILTGDAAINGTGNQLDNSLTGNGAANLLDGRGGNDTLQSGGGNDTLLGGEGSDLLVVGSGNNSLFGGAGNDTLRGGAGSDTLDGGDGNDLIIAGQGAGGSRYEVIQGNITWQQAKADAESRGGHLLTITSDAEWIEIAKQIGDAAAYNSPFWMGATDEAQEGTWKWITGEEWNFSQWMSGEPNNAGGVEHYLQANLPGQSPRTWNDLPNAALLPYLLEIETPASGNNSLTGGSGNDTLQGALGNDTLDGGTGADSMVAGAGDDLYFVDNAADVLSESPSAGSDTVRASVSHSLGANFENLELTGSAAINGTGNDLSNAINGNDAANLLSAGDGNDTVTGRAGNDTLIGYWGNDLLDGGYGNDSLEAGSGADTLNGGAGNDTLIGWDDADRMSGGAGNDLYVIDNAGDVVAENASEGTDTVRSSVAHTLAANVENLVLAGVAAINGTGNALANQITGNAGANRLVAGAGSDTVLGGAGNDTLNGGVGLDTLKGDAGNDLLQIDWTSLAGAAITRNVRKDGTGASASFSGSYTAKNLAGQVLSSVAFDGIERLTLNGQNVDLELAVAAPGVTIKRSSPPTATTEQGGIVEYNVVLDKAPFENVSLAFTSTDTTEGKVNTPTLTFTPQNWNTPQKLVVQGVDDYLDDGNVAYNIMGRVITNDLTYNRIFVPVISLMNNDDGRDRDQNIYGTENTDYLEGKDGNDRIYGKGGQDQIKGGIGSDRLYGQEDNDRLFGEAGNDQLYGGYDDDRLEGGADNDFLFGEQGLDTLIGGAGNDYLDGGIENDSLSGGAGNDTYFVESAGDVINDLGLATDVDTVLLLQTINYTLPANIENASINASGNSNLTGNALNNGLTGNDGRNVLDGGTGNDSLNGGSGADSLLGGIGNDVLVGGAGNDTMRGGDGVDLVDFAAAGVDVRVDLGTGRVTGEGTDLLFDIENIVAGEGQDTLLGNAAGNDLDGGAGIDNLNGGGGNDTLAGCFFGAAGGRGETDSLTGGAGLDIFQLGWSSGRFYDDGIAGNTGRNDYVLITDFTVGQDRLQLDGAAANYYLGASGVSGVTGIGLYAEQGATDELIAIIRSANITQPNTANTVNTAQFV